MNSKTVLTIVILGMLGEYLGKTYSEIKARPRFFIDKVVNQ